MKVRSHALAGRFLIGCAGALTCCYVGGCSENSQDLDERVTQLQKQLDQTQTELQAANQSLKTAKEEIARLTSERPRPGGVQAPAPPPPPVATTSTLPSRDLLEKSYTAKAKALKQELQQKVRQFKVDTCTLYQIDMPSPEYPVTSKISLAVKTNTGSSFHLDVPVKADRAGNWVFPEVTDITQRIEEVGRNAATARSAQTSPRAAASLVPQAPAGRGTGQRADKTVTIQWPGSTPAAPQQPQPAAAQQAQPPAPPAPASGSHIVSQSSGGGGQGMAADRTVVIQWPDGGKSSAGIYQPNTSAVPPVPGPAPAQTQSPADRNVLAQF